ncbi:MAG: hypothetical protein ACD_3C00184G0001 [uncultured bacterium (gcode 4)]|uniref:Uncharacterized protein n=1 Tax=uncultured bacterium (gcode 4) TaxID=1234023 RepID=K2GWC8_9BACT|nr:MAG: hypothetical protein ACD_3C00184G0001 [uncultured bacterium (gcode 4)]
MDNKVRVNAAISYLFLGELFLLAKSNPNFNHPFIRAHSKNAVKIHLIFFVSIFAYKYFWGFFNFLNFQIPVIQLSINTIITTALFLIFTFMLLRWAYKANSWIGVEDIKIGKDYLKMESELMPWKLTETQKMMYISSYIPFIWLIVAGKYPSEINKYWSKIGWLFSVILVLLILNGHSDILLMFSFLYICYVVYVWLMMIIHTKVIYNLFTKNIPDLSEVYIYFRAWFWYFLDSIGVIFGKKEEVSFENEKNKIIRKDKKFLELAQENFTSASIAFSNKIIFIPVINIIYIPKYIFDKKSIYTVAIAQWLIITASLGAIYYFAESFYTNLQMILIFPIFLWIANLDSNPFYKIPIIFEIYVLLDSLTFWIFSKFKFLKGKKNEVKEVSFKV